MSLVKTWKVRIRGIYSTALTKLLLDYNEALGLSPRTPKLEDSDNMFLKLLSQNITGKVTSNNTLHNVKLGNQIPTELLLNHGFGIVQPSVTIRERFGLEELNESPDLDIDDRRDRQGVQVLGKAEAVNAFKSILQSCLDDVIVRRRGVQVERGETWTKEPILTTGITIPGEYAILIPERQVKISRKIQDRQKRSRLFRLGKELAPSNWGILWRTASADQPPDVLKSEVTRLMKEGEALMEKAGQVEAPATLREGNHFMDVEFPALSKKRLDEVRGSVAPTMDGHHYYKACGDRVSSSLDMAEKLLEKGCPRREVEELFKQTIEAEYPTVGSTIEIYHVKLDGKVFHLGTALVESLNQDESLIRFSRVLRGEGFYNGLGTPKEPGDQAVTEARIGEWHFKTQYRSRDGRYKGTYINLNTPTELYPYGVRYVDLEADICIWPDGKCKVLDEEKLDDAVAEGLITEKLARIVKGEIQELVKDLYAY